jgi:hypothetical protein
MDDITALQQMTSNVQASDAHLFDSRPAIQWLSVQPQHNGGNLSFVGQNPTRNAIINYYTSARISGDVAFEISDISGANSCTGSFPAAAGIHRIEWTMRWTPQANPNAAQAGRRGGGGGGGGFGGRGGGGAGAACLTEPNQGGGGGRRGGGGGGRGGGGGGRVDPGVYKVTMTAGGQTYTSTITIEADPLRDGDVNGGR